ncbi:MAG: NusG domain II-containing protein [Clostridiales bacterium]|nr:NusG domain II-containing protein [Clostridiales bacterium]
MKKKDLLVILSAAGLALALLILSRSGLLAPPAPPRQPQQAADIKAVLLPLGTEGEEPLLLMEEEARRTAAPSYLRVTVNNRVYQPIPLLADGIIDITRRGGYHNRVEIRNAQVWMDFATCDNQSCVHQGMVSLDNRAYRALGSQIICLPNEVVLDLMDESEAHAFYGEAPRQSAGAWALPLLGAAGSLGLMLGARGLMMLRRRAQRGAVR